MFSKATISLLAATLLSCGGITPTPQSATPVVAGAPEQLEALLDELWQLNMSTFPGWATYQGIRDHDDRLSDASDEATETYVSRLEEIAARVEGIDAGKLDATDRDTQRMVVLGAQQRRASMVCHDSWWDVNGLGGPQVDYQMMPVFFSIRNPKDLENLEKRYRATARQMEQISANLERGIANGYAPTKANVERALKQLDDYLVSPVDGDPMLKLNLADESRIYDDAGLRTAVVEVVRPALQSYRDLLRNTVLPKARPNQGIADLPQAAECYTARIQGHIGLGYTAAGLHQRGLDELKRVHAGMVEVGVELGLERPTARQVMDHFAGKPEYFAKSESELVEKNQAVVDRARAAMPRAFGRLPVTPIEMRPIEAHRAKDAPAAYYYGAPEDGSRPAYYYVNTADPETRPLFNLEALAFHEAIPGHHQQIALAKEIPGVHIWRRNAGQTAYVEGWALYAEVLADELGLYSDAVTRFGMYNYQAWRAARLVIDTGLHHQGWTRQRAIAFLEANTALPSNEVENEIDRYIAWPGQALAYMVGRMKIQQLRAESELALGDAFSLREFHDAVNVRGAVPLTILTENIHDWTAKMTAETSELPNFGDLWDFSDPEATEAKFREVLATDGVASHQAYRQQLLTQIARTYSLRGMFDEAHAQLDEIEPSLGGAEPVVVVRYMLERGRTFNSSKKKEQAKPLFVEAWQTAKRAGLDGLAVDAAHMMGIVEPPKEAIEWNEKAMAFAEASDDPAAKQWLGALYNNMGWTYHDEKDYERALVLFTKALQWREARSQTGPTRVAKWSIGRALRSLGRNDEATTLQLALESEWDADGKPDGFVYEELAELSLLAKAPDKAKAYFAKAYPLLEAFEWIEKSRLERMKKLGGL